MKERMGKIAIVGLLLFWAFLLPSKAYAWQDLDIKSWISEPGVKLLAVEFYATWCKPCNEAIPRWAKLQEQYRSRGLRVVVVSVQSEGSCSSPEWTPDSVVCDYDGDIARRWNAQNLPQAFLWSWQGNLLVAHGEIDQIEKAVDEYFKTTPRILVADPVNSAGKPLDKAMGNEIKGLVRSELKRAAKFELVADESEIAEIRKLRKKGYEGGYSEHTQCRIGEDLSPNSQLKIIHSTRGRRDRLRLELFSLEKGCLTASSHAPILKDDIDQAVVEAVAKLVKLLSGTIKMPTKPPKRKQRATKKRGKLTVSTEPPGATILINDEPHGKAPFTKELWEGDYELEASLPGYEKSVQTVKVEADLMTEVTIYIVAHGKLAISSTPSDALVKINGKESGKTPIVKAVSQGEYEVEVSKEGFKTEKASLQAESGKTTEKSFSLSMIDEGTLKVSTEPTGAMILANGEELGVAPLEKRLETGDYLIAAQLEGYDAAQQDVVIKHMATEEITLKLMKDYPMNPYKLWGWVSMGVGVAFLGMGGAGAALAAKAADDYKAGDVGAKDTEATMTGLMYAGFGLGAAAITTGIVLWVISPGDKAYFEAQQAKEKTAYSIMPTPDGKGMFMTMSGAF